MVLSFDFGHAINICLQHNTEVCCTSIPEVGMTKRAAIYVRVSTDRQTIENQMRELHRIARRRGWEVVQEYRDAGISGSKGREARPGLDEMLKDAQRGRFDIVWAQSKPWRHTASISISISRRSTPPRRPGSSCFRLPALLPNSSAARSDNASTPGLSGPKQRVSSLAGHA